MKISHYHHSMLSLETDKYLFIFDAFEKPLPETNKRRVFIASHQHEDHYSPYIFNNKRENDLYLLSDDIPLANNYYPLAPDNKYKIEDFEIITFGSTDRGISLILKINGFNFYFSGDLNAWIWKKDELEIQEKEKNDYIYELEKIKDYNIDIACIPLDPRLEEYYSEGIRLFYKIVKPKKIIPIHFRENFSIVKKFKKDFPYIDILEFNYPNNTKTI